MRDYETIETALIAAETGHLVLSTLHTLDATETVNRIISVFPPHQQKQIRLQLAAVLKAVISMRLLPRADGLGRVPAVEVLIATAYIRDCIENKEKTKLIHDAIQAGTSQYGMQTFDQSLYQLYKSGLITLEEALRRATNPNEFKLKIQGIQSTSDISREEMDGVLEMPSDSTRGRGVALRVRQPAARRGPDRQALARRPATRRVSRTQEPESLERAHERGLRLLSVRARGRAELVRGLERARVHAGDGGEGGGLASRRRAGSTTCRGAVARPRPGGPLRQGPDRA